MKMYCLPLAAAWVLAAAMPAATAQGQALVSASAPVSGASAPPAAKAGRKPLTPAEMRDNAAPPDESRPEGAVVPQISIPLGKPSPASSKPTSRATRPEPAASSAGVNDAVARCEAQVSEQARGECRDKLARQGRSR